MTLVMPLTFFVTSALISDDNTLSFNYFLTCLISMTLGILLGAGFSSYVLVTIRDIKFYPFITWFISLLVGVLTGFIVFFFVEPVVSIIGNVPLVIGFFISAWTLSLKSPSAKDARGS